MGAIFKEKKMAWLNFMQLLKSWLSKLRIKKLLKLNLLNWIFQMNNLLEFDKKLSATQNKAVERRRAMQKPLSMTKSEDLKKSEKTLYARVDELEAETKMLASTMFELAEALAVMNKNMLQISKA